MHHVLQIPELLLDILERLAQVDLLHFGSACKGLWCFAEPLLWRHISNTLALRCVLPDDVRVDEGDKGEVILSRPLNEKEWQRALHHCSLIRQLDLSDTQDVEDARRMQDSLFILFTHEGAQNLFPILNSLFLELKRDRSIHAVLSILRQPLTVLQVALMHPAPRSNHLESLIEAVARGDGRLEQLAFTIPDECEPWRGLLSVEFWDMPPRRLLRLRVLRLASVDNEGKALFPLLAEFPLLEYLNVDICDGNNDEQHYTIPRGAFLSLTELLIDATYAHDHPPDLTHLLLSISSPFLEVFDFKSTDLHAVRQAVRLVASKWSRTLNTFRIQHRTREDEETPSEPVDIISPLWNCRRLKTLAFATFACVDFSDDDFSIMSVAWPELELLWFISGDRTPGWQPKATHRSLSTLATKLPALHTLSASINFNFNTWPIAPAGESPSRSGVRRFEAILSHSPRPAETAQLIRAVFPNLETFGCFEGEGMAEVRDLIGLPALGHEASIPMP